MSGIPYMHARCCVHLQEQLLYDTNRHIHNRRVCYLQMRIESARTISSCVMLYIIIAYVVE